jgi:hypothetical protein
MPTRRSFPPLLCAHGVRLAKGELPAGLVERDVRHGGSDCACRDRIDARDRRQSATGIAGAVRRHDPLLDPFDLASDSAQLIDDAVQRDRSNLLDGRLLDGMLRSMTSSCRDDAAGELSTRHFHNNYAKWVIQDHSALTYGIRRALNSHLRK